MWSWGRSCSTPSESEHASSSPLPSHRVSEPSRRSYTCRHEARACHEARADVCLNTTGVNTTMAGILEYDTMLYYRRGLCATRRCATTSTEGGGVLRAQAQAPRAARGGTPKVSCSGRCGTGSAACTLRHNVAPAPFTVPPLATPAATAAAAALPPARRILLGSPGL